MKQIKEKIKSFFRLFRPMTPEEYSLESPSVIGGTKVNYPKVIVVPAFGTLIHPATRKRKHT